MIFPDVQYFPDLNVTADIGSIFPHGHPVIEGGRIYGVTVRSDAGTDISGVRFC